MSGIFAIYFLIFLLKHLLNREYLENIQSFSIENTWWNMNISGYPYFFICFPLEHLLRKHFFFHENTCWLMNIMRISSFFPWKYVLNGWWYQTLLVSLLPVHLHFWRFCSLATSPLSSITSQCLLVWPPGVSSWNLHFMLVQPNQFWPAKSPCNYIDRGHVSMYHG